jgi:hypothetical protein
MKTVAKACIPIVLENKSMVKPKTKPKRMINQFGVSKGNRRINSTYINGFT